MTALIIDDERLARQELRLLLAAHPQIEIVGEAATIAEATELIATLQPELLFLDINLRKGTGFDLLEALSPPLPNVIFTTAYDEFAVRAFDVDALDYLMKPVHPERLATAIERAQTPTVEAMPSGKLPAEGKVVVRDGDRCWLVPVGDIRLITSEGNHCRLHFGADAPLLYRTLNALEERLPAGLFIRANRAQLVNVQFIETIAPWFSQSLKATLRGGEEVEFSRRAAQEFREKTAL